MVGAAADRNFAIWDGEHPQAIIVGVASNALGRSGTTLTTRAKSISTIVSRAVAIVVDSVAEFGRGFNFAGTFFAPGAVHARLSAFMARWIGFSTRLCLPVGTRATFVDNTVAVFVLLAWIADFSSGLDATHALRWVVQLAIVA